LSWSELSSLGLTTVHVIDGRGLETTGVIRRVTSDSLVIMLAGGDDRAFPAGHVARIERRGDSLENGALIGAVVGALPMLLLGSDCHESCATEVAALGVISAGVYGLLGAGIDAMLVGRTTVYRLGSTAGRALGVMVRPSGGAVRFGLRVETR
jgi:hypothetical protein